MKYIQNALWAIIICVLISGCGTYRRSEFPNVDPDIETGGESPRVEKGAVVRVKQVDGEVVSGTIDWMNEEKLGLGDRGNYGHEDLVLEVADIEYVEAREQSDGEIEAIWWASIFVGMVAGATYALSQMKFY